MEGSVEDDIEDNLGYRTSDRQITDDDECKSEHTGKLMQQNCGLIMEA